jgi:Ca2+-transporting ATPase
VCIPWAIGIRYFPDAWFAVIAGHACKPFVISYRLCCRGCSKIAGLFKKSKKNEQSDAEAGEAGVAPTIVVVDNDDARSAKGKA